MTLQHPFNLRYAVRLRARVVATISTGVMALVVPGAATAQCTAPWSCSSRNVGSPPTPPPAGYLSISSPNPASCKDGTGAAAASTELPDGTFVKGGVVRMDTSASLTGLCDWYMWGTYYTTETRYINNVTINTFGPPDWGTWDNLIMPPNPGVTDTLHVYSNVSAQSLDTRVASTTSGPDTQAISDVGEYQFEFLLKGMSTECLISPSTSSPTVRTLNGVACLPNWVKDGPNGLSGNPLLARFPVDAPIRVVYPAALADAVEPAVYAWEAMLSRYGLTTLDFDLSKDGAACEYTDEHCIQVGEGLRTCSPTACGCAQALGISGGVHTHMSEISIKPGMTDMSHKRWVVGHELGHLLGLLDSPQCTDEESVMKTAACNTPPSLGGGRASESDGVAVAKTVYGGGSTRTCGW